MRPSPRFWLILAATGAVIALVAVIAGQALRPDRSVGAPVAPAISTPAAGTAGPVGSETSRAGTASPSSPAAPPSVPVQNAAPSEAPGRGTGQAPVRLSIGSLRVDAPVDPVGVDSQGAMGLPADVHRVGWYRFSPVPGTSSGTVVLAGHVDNAQQGKGALFNLTSAGVGARIVVQSADGSSHVYRVTGRQTFVKKQLPVDRLFATDGRPRLVIITCGGPFIAKLHSYQDNLVVAAEPVGA